mmetsp:Transcript_20530/g.40667  ORF Transcript_20530/g.40667 Transcript_20530/m.40667 type:complete len:89 (-) Transcript_20530:613-879(-)
MIKLQHFAFHPVVPVPVVAVADADADADALLVVVVAVVANAFSDVAVDDEDDAVAKTQEQVFYPVSTQSAALDFHLLQKQKNQVRQQT